MNVFQIWDNLRTLFYGLNTIYGDPYFVSGILIQHMLSWGFFLFPRRIILLALSPPSAVEDESLKPKKDLKSTQETHPSEQAHGATCVWETFR